MDNKREQNQENTFNTYITELGIKINELEERERILKDRILLIGNNLISTKENVNKENLEFKGEIKEIVLNIRSIKQLNQRILNEIGNFARKSEVEILKKQFKMFEPLNYNKKEDIRKIIAEELKKFNKD
ncbi:hypothetical protein GOV12_03040 [Candidatus Pacearchaeota archaeon]|nr:hypothetical protein [Candidatus Pacearchaeota archaeon]